MSTRLTIEALAEGLGLKSRQVSTLLRQGMPRDDIEAARKWREDRTVRHNAPLPANLGSLDDGTLSDTIGRHRLLVARAQGVWEAAMEGGDTNQGKYQTAYNQSLKTLIALEEEQERRLKESRLFIARSEAEDTIRRLMADVVNRLDKLGLDVAEKCNPDNPALAAKVLDAWARRTREELSYETEEAAGA